MEGITYVTKFFWEIEKLTLRVKFETLTQIFKPKLFFPLKYRTKGVRSNTRSKVCS